MKGMELPECVDDDWSRDLAFLVDLTACLKEPNLKLQGENQLVHQLYSHVKTFQAKLRLLETELRSYN
jgi:hypothetical protein